MWKSVILHFSVNTNIFDFLKVNSFFMGFRRLKDSVLSEKKKKKRKLNFSEKMLFFFTKKYVF